MARMILIKFVSQVLLSAGGDDGECNHLSMRICVVGFDCIVVGAGIAGYHLGVGLLTIGTDGFPKAGDLVCHWGVNFLFIAIEADGCPKVGDLNCHWCVDFCSIGADGCPKAGDLSCHWGVGFCSIGVDGCPKAEDLVCHSDVDLFFVGANKKSSSGGDLVVAMSSVVGL